MKLTIIIPIYNEENTIKQIVDKVLSVDYGMEKEIIMVDDGSTDGTSHIINQFNNKEISIYFHPINYGKGRAIKTALRHATGNIIVFQDGDLEYNPEDYKKILRHMLHNNVSIVYGSRFKGGATSRVMPGHFIGNKLLSFMTTLLYQKHISDMETCYKAFRKEILDCIDIESDGFDIEPEITAKLLKKGYDIAEVGISYTPRSYKQGKKICWKDGMMALYILFKYRFFGAQ